MDGNWIKHLENAEGRSEYVVVVFIDIRGFTAFCNTVDDRKVATYISKIYLKILNDYFSDAVFSKPLGDGLLLVFSFTEENLEEVVNGLIDRCVALIDSFGFLVEEEKMIDFDTPKLLGIGISRDTACCIYDETEIIDYSGKVFNLTSRLMNLARPSGVVCDYNSVHKILKTELKELFYQEEVYVRGISEKDPLKILCLNDRVKVSKRDKEPFKDKDWRAKHQVRKVEEWKKVDVKNTLYVLEGKPENIEDVYLRVVIPSYKDGKKIGDYLTKSYRGGDKEIKIMQEGRVHFLVWDCSELGILIDTLKIEDEEDIHVLIQYSI